MQNNNNFTALLFFIPHNPYAISQEDSKSGILGGMQDVVENAILIKRAKSKQLSLLEFKFQYCFQCDCSDRSPEKGAPPPPTKWRGFKLQKPQDPGKSLPHITFSSPYKNIFLFILLYSVFQYKFTCHFCVNQRKLWLTALLTEICLF